LLSPAIGGVRLAGWKAMVQEIPLVSHLLKLPLTATFAYNELQPDSPLLQDLMAHTERLADTSDASVLRATIAWAEREEVVIEREYFGDVLAPRIAGSHTSMTHASDEIRSLVQP